MSCDVKNVIYVLECNGCNEYYIGQTGDKLRSRRTVHAQQIRDPSIRQLPLSEHIDICCQTNPKGGGGSHMRPRTNFVLALHGECLHSNTYKNAFICFEKHF